MSFRAVFVDKRYKSRRFSEKHAESRDGTGNTREKSFVSPHRRASIFSFRGKLYSSIILIHMPSTKLRKVGGSVMMAVPPLILDRLNLRAGAEVELLVDHQRLIVKPQSKPRYTLGELLAQCDADAPISQDDRDWLDSSPAGRELL